MGHIARVGQDIAERCGVQHPVGDALGMRIAAVDIILERRRVTLYVDLEKLGDSVAVVVERAARQRISVAYRRIHPEAVELLAGYGTVASDRIDNPDIAVKEILRHRRVMVLKKGDEDR